MRVQVGSLVSFFILTPFTSRFLGIHGLQVNVEEHS